MSDTTLNRFHGSGTSAERAAFTPTPPTPASGPDFGYTWWDTDEQALYAWDVGGAAWALVAASGVTAIPKTTVVAATTADITIATALNNGDVLDGVTLATGELVLVKNQTTTSQNGIYEVAAAPARIADYNTYNELAGKLITVQKGTANADSIWLCISDEGGGTIDIDPITFTAVSLQTRQLTYIFEGNGVALTTGVKGDLYVPFACTITAATMLADQSGSVVVDIWKDTYANYPPTIADTIVAAAKPTISAAVKSQDTTLTGWTTTISAGDTLRFNIDSASTITRLNLTLTVVL